MPSAAGVVAPGGVRPVTARLGLGSVLGYLLAGIAIGPYTPGFRVVPYGDPEAMREAFRDPAMRPLLLDPPTVMGVESLGLDEVNVRVVARTLPGKQFDVGRDLRARVALALSREGVSVRATSVQDGVSIQDEALAEDRARTGGAA